jgi:hypothetical protein
VYCPTCKRETSPIKIGAESFCSNCGNPYKPHKMNDVTSKPTAAAVSQRVEPVHNPPREHLQVTNPSAPARRSIAFTDRFERARKVSRSTQISRFGAGSAATAPASTPANTTSPAKAAQPSPELPRHAATQHEAMSRLPRHTPPATPTSAKPKPKVPRLHVTPVVTRAVALTAAVVVMGAYIWVQNYPKLALQTAGERAGLSAELPSYMPTSYNLAGTNTGPGLVTLSYKSPSAPDTLKISLHRTTWDSSSLLDNYIAKSADDYAAVQDKGLTIYFWGKNRAAWVNNGIWYSIEGAARLSRQQVLKIAYSL